jgi:hypothetical protein
MMFKGNENIEIVQICQLRTKGRLEIDHPKIMIQ